MASRCCVVICYWTGRAPRALYRLLRQMRDVPAGEPYDVVIVCNGGDQRPLRLPADLQSPHIELVMRPNAGWNLAAWDEGWRRARDHEYFLFLQAECVIRTAGWLARFVRRMESDSTLGLVGERLSWQNMTWEYAREATRLDLEDAGRSPTPGALEAIDAYRTLLTQHGIDPGTHGTHLDSIILFSSRRVLEQIGGLPVLGDSYLQAVASEIGASRRVVSAGYRIAQLADEPFFRISHTQWMPRSRFARLRERVQDKLDRVFGWH